MRDEVLRKLLRARTAEEVVDIVDEAGGAIELDDAEKYIAYRSRKEISEEDLAAVAGGQQRESSNFVECPGIFICDNYSKIPFLVERKNECCSSCVNLTNEMWCGASERPNYRCFWNR
ncbi:MAG: hypothetical protein LBL80_04435 [Ruminococcus sp.]|jgi:hypothetical protein|nr:hypothetical protein [Ruminococcus sp.]